MSKLEKLDRVIGEALEQLMVAASTVKECNELDESLSLRLIGDATVTLWDFRDIIYSLEPELKPDFVKEFDNNKDSYEKQAELHRIAKGKEARGDKEAAILHYQQLLESATINHFKTLAEAGLYRIGSTT